MTKELSHLPDVPFHCVVLHENSKTMLKFFFRFLIIFIFDLGQVAASDLYEYNRPVRALGMGNVYLNFVKDTDAPALNPAALGFITGISVEMVNLGFGLNGTETLAKYQKSANIQGASDYDKFFGKNIWLGLNARVSATMPNFGLTAYDDGNVSMILRNTAFPNMDLSFFNDYGLIVAGAFPVAPLTSMGVAIKRINRWGGYQTVGLSTIAAGNSAALKSEFENKGVFNSGRRIVAGCFCKCS